MLLFVIAEHTLVLHGELDALAGLGAAVDQVAGKNDAVTRGDLKLSEELDGLMVTAVEVSDDDGS